ncbi:MAG: hypothetical protein J2P53_10020 [Bradyrhizobiaceae bacterium]|nr:hypothetical protein [Bradyrhizobiaceae bacterium]
MQYRTDSDRYDVIVAGSNLAPSRPETLTAKQVEHLADRLFSRGSSVLMKDTPGLAGDLRTASRLLRKLLREIDGLAATAGDSTRTLAKFSIEVEV